MRHFKSQETTTAGKSAVWHVWMDVPRWQAWDTELESATLEGPMRRGAKGTLKPKQGPASAFEITEYTEGESFTYTVNLPLAKLHVAHYFIGENTFVHDVAFKGVSAWFFGRLLGGRYAAALPGVLARIKALAEKADTLHDVKLAR